MQVLLAGWELSFLIPYIQLQSQAAFWPDELSIAAAAWPYTKVIAHRNLSEKKKSVQVSAEV